MGAVLQEVEMEAETAGKPTVTTTHFAANASNGQLQWEPEAQQPNGSMNLRRGGPPSPRRLEDRA